MNDQQVWSLVAACAVLMIPLGALFGALWRGLRRWGQRHLPPRHLERVGRRRRRAAAGRQA